MHIKKVNYKITGEVFSDWLHTVSISSLQSFVHSALWLEGHQVSVINSHAATSH